MLTCKHHADLATLAYYEVSWNRSDHEDTPSADDNRTEEFDTESEALEFAKTINAFHYVVVTRCQTIKCFPSK